MVMSWKKMDEAFDEGIYEAGLRLQHIQAFRTRVRRGPRRPAPLQVIAEEFISIRLEKALNHFFKQHEHAYNAALNFHSLVWWKLVPASGAQRALHRDPGGREAPAGWRDLRTVDQRWVRWNYVPPRVGTEHRAGRAWSRPGSRWTVGGGEISEELLFTRIVLVYRFLLVMHDEGITLDACPQMALAGYGEDNPPPAFGLTARGVRELSTWILDDGGGPSIASRIGKGATTKADALYQKTACNFLKKYASSWKAQRSLDVLILHIAPGLSEDSPPPWVLYEFLMAETRKRIDPAFRQHYLRLR